MSEQLTACISGSFKFKPEIDALHEEFADHGVTILESTKGWLYVPSQLPQAPATFRPLPLERGMTAKQVEDRFLAAVIRADFLYVSNKHKYLGTMAAFEVGFAMGAEKPIFASEPVTLENLELDLANWQSWDHHVTVATPAEAAAAMRNAIVKS